jgi:hypothetical protein
MDMFRTKATVMTKGLNKVQDMVRCKVTGKHKATARTLHPMTMQQTSVDTEEVLRRDLLVSSNEPLSTKMSSALTDSFLPADRQPFLKTTVMDRLFVNHLVPRTILAMLSHPVSLRLP